MSKAQVHPGHLLLFYALDQISVILPVYHGGQGAALCYGILIGVAPEKLKALLAIFLL